MDPRERLRKGTQAFKEGRYQDSLEDYVWFHEHALEFRPALHGVRLSFALLYWAELAMVYPPARTALREIRDRKASSILAGQGDQALFRDIVRINEHAFSDRATYDLFVALRDSFPTTAAEYARLALPAIAACCDFQLARQYLPDPEGEIMRLSGLLTDRVEELRKRPPAPAPELEAHVHNHAKSIKLILAILRGVGESQLADKAQRLAAELIESPEVRNAVWAALVGAEPPLGGIPAIGQN